jgi:hypothetical protein
MNKTLTMGPPKSKASLALLAASEQNKQNANTLGKKIDQIKKIGPITLKEAAKAILSEGNETKRKAKKRQRPK